jgi:hypothetical protein
MKKFLIAALFALLPAMAFAQTVTSLPEVIPSGAVTDLGNGPLEYKLVQGNAGLFTSQGSGTGSTSGSSTALTLTAVPTTPPCQGCIIAGAGITSGTTVAAFNAVTSITLSAAMTVVGGTTVTWGAACPAIGSAPSALVQASVGGDVPFYTQSRVCGSGNFGPGAQVLPFAIGAH